MMMAIKFGLKGLLKKRTELIVWDFVLGKVPRLDGFTSARKTGVVRD